MRLILDTHAFLWFAGGDERLSGPAREAIEDANNEIVVGVASIWEIAIKHSTDKRQLAESIDEFLGRELKGYQILDINAAQALKTSHLPFHHRDPFDRILVATCMTERLPIVSVDDVFDVYGISRFWIPSGQ